MSSDQTDAATMTPEAKPRKSVLTFCEISFLKNHTTALPSVVAKKMTENPSTVIAVFPMYVPPFGIEKSPPRGGLLRLLYAFLGMSNPTSPLSRR